MNTQERLKTIDDTISTLANEQSYVSVSHAHGADVPMPSTDKLREIVRLCREIIFPGYFGDTMRRESIKFYIGLNVDTLSEMLKREIYAGLCFSWTPEEAEELDVVATYRQADELTVRFIAQLPELRRLLKGDVLAIFNGDPAALNTGEVIFAYPGIRAISNYRIAHALYKMNVPLIPRIITEMAHSETGIDIHPRAQIGENFAIDHGTGVVIGATSIIGNNVKIYQGVTLGAKSFPMDENGNPIKGIPRHPIIEDNVVIYSQATILGRVTIGHDSTIGGNVWITENIPAGSKIVQKGSKNYI